MLFDSKIGSLCKCFVICFPLQTLLKSEILWFNLLLEAALSADSLMSTIQWPASLTPQNFVQSPFLSINVLVLQSSICSSISLSI